MFTNWALEQVNEVAGWVVRCQIVYRQDQYGGSDTYTDDRSPGKVDEVLRQMTSSRTDTGIGTNA
jgi:hypothetical protein